MIVNDMETVNTVLEEFYQEFKTDIRLDKEMNYNAYVFKESPSTPILPNIQIKTRGIPKRENLSYGERQWHLMIDVNVYTQDKHNFDRRTIATDLQESVYDFFYNDKGMECTFNDETPNLDANVHRILLRFRCVYDIDTGIIYRK